jgi:hypothetical protein
MGVEYLLEGRISNLAVSAFQLRKGDCRCRIISKVVGVQLDANCHKEGP